MPRASEPGCRAHPGQAFAGLLVSVAYLPGLPDRANGNSSGPSRAQSRMSDEQVIRDLRSYLDGLNSEDCVSGAVLVARKGKVLFGSVASRST